MGLPRVAAFTDTYLPTVNGVTYTIQTWRDQWSERGGSMSVVFPNADGYDPVDDEYPVRSLPFPFYEGFHIGMPRIPAEVRDVDVVHSHTPFGVGLAGRRLARTADAPLVASYHTPTSEYAEYISLTGTVERAIRRSASAYERWFFNRTATVITPSERTREHLLENVDVTVPVEVVPNGVDTDFFRPVDTESFRRRHDVPDGPVVGYTGRHGYEKNLDLLLDAVDGIDATVLVGGDGPARADLEDRASEIDADVRFLGFLDREELPAFYATLDAFAFPSPVETQGLVALEANACGTPVAGVDSGALSDTIESGVTGYKADADDCEDFRSVIDRTLDECEDLSTSCLDSRERISVDHAVDRLSSVYDEVL
ncbi:glycosyltransferase [Haloarculaceae archaeon H-GB2-1]|nr:glycosyltransferase [Haloarculaceae archaeon H-GB1-1]MEA5408566.1 glycosyltransferase [Haloarculaceae archaeon H-GB2-1]